MFSLIFLHEMARRVSYVDASFEIEALVRETKV